MQVRAQEQPIGDMVGLRPAIRNDVRCLKHPGLFTIRERTTPTIGFEKLLPECTLPPALHHRANNPLTPVIDTGGVKRFGSIQLPEEHF